MDKEKAEKIIKIYNWACGIILIALFVIIGISLTHV
jgi:hypothetical protein